MSDIPAVPQIDPETPLAVEEAKIEIDDQNSGLVSFWFGTLLLTVLAALSLGIGGLVVWQKGNPTTLLVSEVKSSPTPVPQVITFEVLNGSGFAGLAGKAAKLLTDHSLEVVVVGNADLSNYKNNHLYLTSNLTNQGETIKEKLAQAGVEVIIETEVLTGSTASARIIIGR